MSNTFLKRSGLSRGFTLMEALVVMGVIAVLAMMTIPSLVTVIPNFQARKAAETTSSLMLMARMTAANTQKPVRAVVNCAAADEPCRLTLYTAVLYDSTASPPKAGVLTGWKEVPNVARNIGRQVRVSGDASSSVFSGNPVNVYWAVFLPKGGLLTSSHEPMNLILQPGNKNKPAWAISVDKATGRVAARSK